MGDLVNQTAESFGFDIWIFLSQVISFVIVAVLRNSSPTNRFSKCWSTGGSESRKAF